LRPLSLTLFIGAALLVVGFFPGQASAHPPLSVELVYQDGMLNVTITHPVLDPENHYVQNVTVEVNGATVLTQNYTTQPATVEAFSYEYEVDAGPGDVITATATCSILGSLGNELQVPGMQMNATFESDRYSLAPAGKATVTLTLEYGGEPVMGATVQMDVTGGGSAGDATDHSDGTYTAVVTAPAEGPATMTVRCTAAKAGYENVTEELTITVKSGGGGGDGGDGGDGGGGDGGTDGGDGNGTYEPEKNKDEKGIPGFAGAALVAALAAGASVALFSSRRKR